jgi:hypothetical protein
MLVLGIVLLLSVLVIPLTLTIRTGLGRAVADANMEKASAAAESIAKVYRRMLQAAVSEGLEADDLRELAKQLEEYPPDMGVDVVSVRVLPDEPALPNRLEIVTESGNGPSKRQRKFIYYFRFQPPSGGGGGSGPGSGSTGEEFYYKHGIVYYTPKYNGYFKVCDSDADVSSLINTDYSNEQFLQEFNRYIGYYVGLMESEPLRPRQAAVPEIPDGAPSDLNFGYIGNQTMNGDVAATGNITFTNYVDNLVIEGNLVAGGNIEFSGINHLHVKGDVIAGGNLNFNGWSGTVTIEGDVTADNIDYGGGNTITVGRWNGAANDFAAGSFTSLIAGQAFNLRGQVTHFRVSGDFSSGTFNSNNHEIKYLRVGGSFITGGDLAFTAKFERGQIDGFMSVGKDFDTSSVGSLIVGQSLIVGETLTFGNDITELDVGGSLVALGEIVFRNFIAKLVVTGDLLVNGDMGFKDIRDRFQVGGLFAVLGDLTFENHLPYAEDINRFGGFYVGGTMDMPSWVNQNGNKIFCIAHNPPPVGGGGSGGATIEFGNWSGE